MRICGLCRRPPRRDDPLGIAQIAADQPDAHAFLVGCFGVIPSGTVTSQACRQCMQKLAGGIQPDPVYPPGSNMPFPVCGICRLALREDDGGDHYVRLQASDVEGYSAGGQDIQPGHYSCCQDCLTVFRPRVLARLVRQGILANVDQATDNHLV